MKTRASGDTSSWFGLPRWIALILGASLFAGMGFLLWFSAEAFSRTSTLDARRVRALNIAADYIAKWPAVATTIGQTSLYHRGKANAGEEPGTGNVFYAYLYHPEFGDFQVKYDLGQDQCDQKLDIYKNRLTVMGEALGSSENASEPEKSYIERARNASWVPLRTNRDRVCFTIANLDLGRVAPLLATFSHLLLIEDPQRSDEKSAPTETQTANWRGGRVVAWVGPYELPIRRLTDLPALENEVSKVVVATAEATLAASTRQEAVQRDSRATDALEPFDSRVAGKGYRFYWRPILLDLPGELAETSQRPASYYLVGVAPSRVAPEPGQSRTEVLGFTLALFMLIALVPVVKLALLGPVDSMKAIEVAAICLGIVAAAALGTALWTGIRDVLVARSAASIQVANAAAGLVQDIHKELHSTLLSPEMNQLSKNLGRSGSKELVIGSAPVGEMKGASPIAKVENLVLLDANGRQAAGTVMKAARDHVGANFDLSDRVYFRRAMDEDFAPGAEHLAKARQESDGPCSIWNDIEKGLVFEQIRSRTDGAPKTIVAAKLRRPAQSLTECDPVPAELSGRDDRLQPSAVIAAFVMPSMLSPKLDPGMRYAVVDVHEGAVGRPVMFHSDSYRAGVELFDESLNAATRARLGQEIGDPDACGSKDGATVPHPKEFSGIYEEEPTLFAVARVPCTDWAVVALKSRRSVDAQAVKPAFHAIIVWASLTIFPYFLWMIAALRWGDRAWVWLWPEPTSAKRKAYRVLTGVLAGSAVLAMLLVGLASPFKGFLLSALSAIAALGWLGWVHYQQELKAFLLRLRSALIRLRSALADRGLLPSRHKKPAEQKHSSESPGPDDKKGQTEERSNATLDGVTERWFSLFVITLVIAVSVVPVAALAADARAYFAQVSAAEREASYQDAHRKGIKLQTAIARMEGLSPPPPPPPPLPPAKQTCPDGSVILATDACPHYFTEGLRRAAGYEHGLKLADAPPTHWLLGMPYIGFIDGFVLVSLALMIVAILGLAIWASMWGLFGFGVAVEAVEYPQLNVGPHDDGSLALPDNLPPRFLVIRANDNHLKVLKRDAVEIDLNEDIRAGRKLRPIKGDLETPGLVLIHNLGLLLGDPDFRRKALERLEQILAKQFDRESGRPNYRVAILTSLTPLERLLQSFERERDENDQLGEEQKSTARLERAKHREDMRWSAVFEEFTTYYHAPRPRPAPAGLDQKSVLVRRIWRELQYVPDHVVAAMIWDPSKPLTDNEILNWARDVETKSNPRPQAIVDHLASNLIEHYHLMWSLSSRAERLLLYRIAHGHVPNVAKAYALRSLVKRGLVVLDPYPRTMNESFAQFVKHVEKPETIKNWRRTQEHGFWDAARLLFGLLLPLALGVLLVAAIRNGYSIAAIAPLLVAAGPALINALGSARRTAAA